MLVYAIFFMRLQACGGCVLPPDLNKMCAFEDISNVAQNLYTLRASDYGGNVDFRIDRQAGERAYHCGSLTETLVRDRISGLAHES